MSTTFFKNVSGKNRKKFPLALSRKETFFNSKLDIFSLMCAADKVWITELTLIHKNIRSVRNLHAQVYRSIWCKTHYDVTVKNNSISSEGLDRHYHECPSSSIGLAEILAIISVSTFKISIILISLAFITRG